MANKKLDLTSPVADGSTANEYDTENTLTSGKLVSWLNKTVEKAYVDFEGSFSGHDGAFSGDLTVGGIINAGGLGIHLEDDELIKYGTGTDYWMNYNLSGTQFLFRSSDVDGGGTDGTLFSVQDGTDDFVFVGDIAAAAAAFTAVSASGIVLTTDATDATSATAASLKTAGGIASAKALWVGTTSRLVGAVTMDAILSVDDTTDTTSGITGSIHTDGGLGIAKALWVATTTRLVGNVTIDAGLLAAGDDQGAIGASGTAFSDLFLASGAVINFSAGDVTLTHSAAKLTWGGDGAVEIDFNSHEMTNVDIDSGAIDNTTIGATTPAAGSFTTGVFSGDTVVDRDGDATTALFSVTGDAGQLRILALQTGGVNRANIRLSSDAESGSNAGSDLQIRMFDDAGSSLGNALTITRATLGAVFAGALTSTGDFDVNTTTFTVAAATGNTVANGTMTALDFVGTIGSTTPAAIKGTTGEFTTSLVLSGTAGAAGMDVNPGSDTDADLITVGVTGAPKLWWDESEDAFVFNTPVIFPDGTKAAPGWSFAGDTDQGMYSDGTGIVVVASNTRGARFQPVSKLLTLPDVGSFDWSSTGDPAVASDVALWRDAAGVLALRKTTAAQTFRVYGTYTDASNYERISIAADGSGGVSIAAETAGTGADNMSLTLTTTGTGGVTSNGNMGIGAAHSANADLKLEAGRLMLKESATPSADSGYGKIYTKTTDKFFFQDGAGVEREVVLSDHASMLFHASETLTVDYANVFNLVDVWSSDGPATISTADQASNQLVFGASRDYRVTHCMEGLINAAAQLIAITVFSIDQTTATITGITAADPGVVTTAAAHGLTENMKVKFTGIVGTMSALNNRIFLVGTVADATHFEIQDLSDTDFDTTGLGYTSDGATAEAISTGSHTHQTYPNNVRTATCGIYEFTATKDDTAELYVANDAGTTDFDMESARMMIHAI